MQHTAEYSSLTFFFNFLCNGSAWELPDLRGRGLGQLSGFMRYTGGWRIKQKQLPGTRLSVAYLESFLDCVPSVSGAFQKEPGLGSSTKNDRTGLSLGKLS